MKTQLLFLIATAIATLGFGQVAADHYTPGSGGLNDHSMQTITSPQTLNVIFWSGLTDNDWNNPGNWDGNLVPLSTDDVIIPVALLNNPVLLAGQIYQCNNLDVEGPFAINGTLEVNGNLVISPTGSMVINAHGSLTVDINITIMGSLLVKNLGSMINYGEITGDATIQRYVPSNMAWHLLSSPVSGQSICNGVFAPVFPGNTFPGNISTWDVYNWLSNCPTPPNPPENWRNLRRPNGKVNTVDFPGLAFVVTRGYLVAYGAGWPTTKNFIGPPSNCTKVCSFYDVVDPCSWALPGNPFPSAIDWRLVPDKSNLATEYYYVWNENKVGGPGYEYWKDNTHFSSSAVDGYIPPMQGFFVRVDPNGGLFLTLPNEARVHHNSTDTWLKDIQVNKLTIKLGNGANYDEAFIQFENNSSMGQDRNDAEKMFSMSTEIPQVYTIVNNDMKTALNAIPYVDNGTTVPVGIVAPAEGDYSISVSGIENFSSMTGLSLEDLKLNYTQNLLLNPVYNFTAAGNEDAGRFLLHFAGPIGISELNTNMINISSNEKTVLVTCSAGFKNAQVTVSNLLGQEIVTKNLTDQTINQVEVNGLKGYYIVKVQNESSVKTAKVYIN